VEVRFYIPQDKEGETDDQSPAAVRNKARETRIVANTAISDRPSIKESWRKPM